MIEKQPGASTMAMGVPRRGRRPPRRGLAWRRSRRSAACASALMPNMTLHRNAARTPPPIASICRAWECCLPSNFHHFGIASLDEAARHFSDACAGENVEAPIGHVDHAAARSAKAPAIRPQKNCDIRHHLLEVTETVLR